MNQDISANMAAAGRYISDYNIFMGSLVGADLSRYFPADMKLICHWGIRDELKARYADKQGLLKQQPIYQGHGAHHPPGDPRGHGQLRPLPVEPVQQHGLRPGQE